MVCPKCGAEYRPGFSMCADCHIPLVLPGREPGEEDSVSESVDLESDQELRQVLDSHDSSFIADVVTALERAEIPYLLQSGTAMEHSHSIVGRRGPADWHGVLYVAAGFEDRFAELLGQIKSRPLADESDRDRSE